MSSESYTVDRNGGGKIVGDWWLALTPPGTKVQVRKATPKSPNQVSRTDLSPSLGPGFQSERGPLPRGSPR